MNETYKRISELCVEKGITIGKMANDLNIRQGLFSDLKRGDSRTLSVNYTSQIANYLGVSMEYLATGKENDQTNIMLSDEKSEEPASTSKEEINLRLLSMLDGLDSSELQRVQDFIAGLRSFHKN